MIYSHPKIDFVFNKNSDNFIVEEIPLYSFDHTGEWLMLKIRKKNITTFEMIKRLAYYIGINKKEIGYAGLKDKDGLTIQWISIPRKYRDKIASINDKDFKILETDLHRNKLKVGHLKGNNFFIRLKKVNPNDKKIIFSILKDIKTYGIPNFFDYQRFGKYQDNHIKGEQLLKGEIKIKDKKLRKLLISAYQAYSFNMWLKKRIEISNLFDLSKKELLVLGYKDDMIDFVKSQNHIFKLLLGDVMMHYPFGKEFYLEKDDVNRFINKDITITGLLFGKKVKRAILDAREIEKEFDKEIDIIDGSRRFAWIFPDIIDINYIKQNAWLELKFFLVKGAYATNLIKILSGRLYED